MINKSMRRGARGVLTLSILLTGTVGAAPMFAPGERVFVPLYSENLREDGYATGVVDSVVDGKLRVSLTEYVKGKGKTLYGTCSPSARSPLAGAEILSDRPDALLIRQDIDPASVKSWREGKNEYLERENLSTLFYKWLGDGMAVTPERARYGRAKAEALGLPLAARAMEVVALQTESTGGKGFPVPPSMALAGAAGLLEALLPIVRENPEALDGALEILDGTAPAQGDDLLAMALARTLSLVRHDLEALQRTQPDFGAASREVPGLRAVFDAWIAVVTRGGAAPYLNRSAAQWKALFDAASPPVWPPLP